MKVVLESFKEAAKENEEEFRKLQKLMVKEVLTSKGLLFDGDIIINNPLLHEIVEASERDYEQSRKKRWAYRDFFYPETIWETAPAARDSLMRAMEFWQNNTCVTFRPRTNETQYAFFTGALDMCSSTVGRDTRQPRQPVFIGRGCYAVRSEVLVQKGTINGFARNAAFPSLLALNEELQGTMGNMEGPSFLDLEIINRHYQCTALCIDPSGFGGNLCELVASSAPLNCGRLIAATSKLTRLRVRMTIGLIRRQCVYHIRAPPNRRIMIGIQQVEGKCQEGCYTRAVEVKMNGDFRPVGYRYCCQSQSFRRLISRGRNVVIIFFAQNGTLDATLYFRWGKS
ncbi:CUB domain protein [Ostertagia ostertagi]